MLTLLRLAVLLFLGLPLLGFLLILQFVLDSDFQSPLDGDPYFIAMLIILGKDRTREVMGDYRPWDPKVSMVSGRRKELEMCQG